MPEGAAAMNRPSLYGRLGSEAGVRSLLVAFDSIQSESAAVA